MSLSPFPSAQFSSPRALSRSITYFCAWCQVRVSPNEAVVFNNVVQDPRPERAPSGISIQALHATCPNCTRPTYFEGPSGIPDAVPDDDKELILQVPAPDVGEDLLFLPEHIHPLYAEARRCMSVKAYTAAAHLFRKLLVNMAVTEGLPPPHNVQFVVAINFLEKNNSIPRNTRGLLDRVRDIGNAAAHQLAQVTAADAYAALFLTTAMLRNLYHLPEVAKAKNDGR